MSGVTRDRTRNNITPSPILCGDEYAERRPSTILYKLNNLFPFPPVYAAATRITYNCVRSDC